MVNAARDHRGCGRSRPPTTSGRQGREWPRRRREQRGHSCAARGVTEAKMTEGGPGRRRRVSCRRTRDRGDVIAHRAASKPPSVAWTPLGLRPASDYSGQADVGLRLASEHSGQVDVKAPAERLRREQTRISWIPPPLLQSSPKSPEPPVIGDPQKRPRRRLVRCHRIITPFVSPRKGTTKREARASGSRAAQRGRPSAGHCAENHGCRDAEPLPQ